MWAWRLQSAATGKCERRAFVGPAFALICVVNRFTQPDQARRLVTP